MNIAVIKEHFKEIMNKNKAINVSLLSISLFTVLAIGLPFYNILFEIKPTIANFDKVIISNASINNLNIAKRVSLYNNLLLSIFIASAFLFYCFKRFFADKIQSIGLLQTAQKTSILGVLSIATSVVLYNSELSVYWIVLLNLFLVLGSLKENNTHLKAILPLLVSLPFIVFVFSYIKNKNIFTFLNEPFQIKGIAVPIDGNSLLFILLTVVFSLLLFLIFKFNTLEDKKAYTLAIPILAVIPVLTFVFEWYNILNKRFQLVINSPFVTFLILLLVGTAISFYFNKKKISFSKAESIVLGTFVLAIALLICLPYRNMYPPYEFFETANDGIAIEHFVNHGKIPFVENFDAHMFQHQFFSYIYVLLNGYEPFAPSLYILYFLVIEIVVFYFVMRKAIGSIPALVLIIGLPSIHLVLNEFALSGLLLLFIYKTIKTPSFKNHLWFWIIGLLLCFYKLDVGYASLLSGMVLLLIFNKSVNQSFYITHFIKSALLVVAPIGIVFTLLCLIKEINPFLRVQEFLLAAMSDQSWGITKMGDQTSFLFRIFYYILPICATVLMVVVFLKKIAFKAHAQLSFLLLGTFFYYFFFVFNAQRGIVFHNYEYGNLIRISSTLFISVLFLILYFDKKKQLIYFSFAFFSFFVVLNSSNASFSKDKHKSLLEQAVVSPSFHEKFLELKASKSRVVYPYSLSEIEYFKQFLDATLTKEETYYDFSSTNMLYPLVGRISPSYVNQSPLMLNGEKAQLLELEKIKEKDIKIVLMPIKNNIWHAISEVYVDFKYYRLAEYFYANYKPLYRNSLFDVYVRKDKFESFNKKLATLGSSNANFTITDFAILNEPTISKNNVAVTIQNNQCSIKSSGAQAYFIGLVDALRKKQLLKNENLPSKLIFNTFSTTTGNVKLYWKINPSDSFSENNSKTFELTPNNNQELVVELNKVPNELMVAINAPEIRLNEFSIIGNSKATIHTPERIDYFIGFVPYLWGEKTDSTIFNTIPEIKEFTEESNLSLPVKAINRNLSGTYLCFDFDSDKDQTVTVEIEKNNEIKATYGVSLVKGRHRYQFKISNNYYWWNLSDFNVNIKTQSVVTVKKLALVSEDLKERVTYKSRGLTLSNLTDENWKLGVSKAFKMVLLDYSPKKENQLKSAKKIRFRDGVEVTIQGYHVAGNYIQVYLNETDISKINTDKLEPIAIELKK